MRFVFTLREYGINFWHDREAIEAGTEFQAAIEEALRNSDTLVAVLSPRSVQSSWVLFELGAALADRKLIIPVLLGDVSLQNVPLSLKNRQYIQASSPEETGRQVAEIIQNAISSA